jgi:hypothetical protein
MEQFVIVYDEEGAVTEVWSWWDWLQIPVSDRDWRSELVHARDALDAYIKSTKEQTDGRPEDQPRDT